MSSKTKAEIRLFSDLSDKDQTVYKWRVGVVLTEDSVITICRFHELSFCDMFFQKNSKCCNIYNNHKKKKKPDGTHNITLEITYQLQKKNIHVVPGWKLCRNCHQKTK